MTPTPDDSEATLVTWMAQESHRREATRLRRYRAHLETLQLVSLTLMLGWTGAMACGFQLRPDLLPAEVAALVTVLVLGGGGWIVWHLTRLKRETARRLAAETAEESKRKKGEESNG